MWKRKDYCRLGIFFASKLAKKSSLDNKKGETFIKSNYYMIIKIIDEVVEFNDLNKEAEEMHRQTYKQKYGSLYIDSFSFQYSFILVCINFWVVCL